MKRLLSVLCMICVCLFLLTVSIGLPIYIRPFYYAHIEAFDLARVSGYSEAEIREAYDEVLDYLTLPGREFGTGELPHSLEGKAHFEDCKVLFDLNGVLLLVSAAITLSLWLLNKRRLIDLQRPWGFAPSAVASTAGLALFVVLGALVAIDFNAAFTDFHTLFFPGKSNWLFDPATDEIILALPETFFMNCAMLIGASVIGISALLVLRGIKQHKRSGE